MSDHSAPPESFQTVMERKHLPALDGFRAIAVFTVLAYHYTNSSKIPGDLGVSGFFVLSGFLITWLLLREFKTTGDISLRDFYVRRTLRIFPAYYVYVTFSLVVDTVRHHPWNRELIISAYAYLVNYFNAIHNHPTTSVAHAWSLAVEEQFYLIWPVLFLMLWRGGARMTRWVVAGLIVAVMLWRSWLYLSYHSGSAYVYNAFDTRFDNLAVGCLLALCANQAWLVRHATQIGRAAWMPLITLVLLLYSRLRLPATYHYSVGFTIDAILVAVLLVQLLQLSATPMWRWLNHPVTRYLGVISYPLYLYHGWGASVGDHVPGVGAAGRVLVSVVAAIGMASASYYVIEKPFLRLKRRWEVLRVPPAEAGVPVVGT